MKTLLIIFLMNISLLFAQNPEWKQFIKSDEILALKEDGEQIWAGSINGGLIKINRLSGDAIFYNTANSGLPSNNVHSIEIDDNGTKWILTENGLASFDGLHWTVYDMSGNEVLGGMAYPSSAIDPFGNIWFAGEGLVKFDGSSFTRYLNDYPYNWINSIAIDDSGCVWIGTNYAGLLKFSDHIVEVYDSDNSGLQTNHVSAIAIDHLGNKWIGSGNEYGESILIKYDGTNWITYNYSNTCLPRHEQISIIKIDDSGNKWLGVSSGGLVRFNDNNCMIFDRHNSGFPSGSLASLTIDDDGNKWIGTAEGALSKFDDNNWQKINTSNCGLQGNVIRALAIDNSNHIWVCSRPEIYFPDNELTKYDYENWVTYNFSDSGWAENSVSCMVIDDFDNKWIGTLLGLYKFDGTSFTVYDASNSSLPANHISNVNIDNSGNLWMVSYEIRWSLEGGSPIYKGLTKFDGFNWITYDTSNSDIPSNQITTFKLDHMGNVWMITNYESLVKFDGSNWNVYTISNTDLQYIQSIAVDDSNNIWLSGSDNYMQNRILVEFDGYTWLTYDVSFESDGYDGRYSILGIDKDGNIWMNLFYYGWGWTGFWGLYKYDGSTMKIYTTENSGLPSDYITNIAFDGYGNKWIGTERGLAVFNENGVVPVEDFSQWTKTVPDGYSLSQNYPNPFNPSTNVEFSLPHTEFVTLKIYNVLGEDVTTLVSERFTAGKYNYKWDAGSLASGVYLYRIQAGNYVEAKKMVLLR